MLRRRYVRRYRPRPRFRLQGGCYVRRRRRRGGNLKSFARSFVRGVKSGVNFLRNNKVISRAAEAADILGVPGANTVRRVSNVLGFGRRRRRRRVARRRPRRRLVRVVQVTQVIRRRPRRRVAGRRRRVRR